MTLEKNGEVRKMEGQKKVRSIWRENRCCTYVHIYSDGNWVKSEREGKSERGRKLVVRTTLKERVLLGSVMHLWLGKVN